MKEGDTKTQQAKPGESRQSAVSRDARTTPEKSAMSKSMHDGVEIWCDCCSCEAEPYWVEAMRNEYGPKDVEED